MRRPQNAASLRNLPLCERSLSMRRERWPQAALDVEADARQRGWVNSDHSGGAKLKTFAPRGRPLKSLGFFGAYFGCDMNAARPLSAVETQFIEEDRIASLGIQQQLVVRNDLGVGIRVSGISKQSLAVRRRLETAPKPLLQSVR